MILIYNEAGLHDTLLCVLKKQDDTIDVIVDKKDDINILKQNDMIIGINIENAKDKFENLHIGVMLEANTKIEKEVISFLEKQNVNLLDDEHTLKQQFVIGYVKECVPHPDSNKLSVCQVDVASETLQIVCGAPNVTAEQKVIVAKPGCMMPTGLLIEPSVLRKVASNGMICSGRELGLPEIYQTPGILELSNTAPTGELFFNYFEKEMM